MASCVPIIARGNVEDGFAVDAVGGGPKLGTTERLRGGKDVRGGTKTARRIAKIASPRAGKVSLDLIL